MKLRRPGRTVLLVLLAVVVILVGLGLRALGRFLVVSDPLEPADAIFVLEGDTPVREVGAAELYRRGLAPRVVIALARDVHAEARRLAGKPSRQERAARALQHAGVAPTAIVRLSELVDNTAEELRADFEYARGQGFRRVIFVTSPYHTRRVRLIWSVCYQAQMAALVHPTPFEPVDPRRWWRFRRYLEESLHELGGIVNFLVGSPIPTFERR